ncbi:hypothetical protein [Sporichthya polymorpha]|uniref:hypothetical protein n=1 Tax=Sporichthya polymorpha TaxID=35751 RepID=UPI000380E5C3|nr:hypothetical protein [Sporichthya polymorpha]
MTPNATFRPEDRMLRRVMQVDAWVSFYTPAVFLLCVPVLAVADVPGWLVTTVVLVAAVVLGGCGIVMAAVCAVAVARGRLEFPDQPALEHFHLVGPVGTRGLHVPTR